MILSGTFQITDWQESVDKELSDGKKLSSAIVQQSYSGDLVGTSEVRYQLFHASDNLVTFIGHEILILDGTGEPRTLVFEHSGSFKDGTASGSFTVIASSDKSLLGRTGSFTSAEDWKANYQINEA